MATTSINSPDVMQKLLRPDSGFGIAKSNWKPLFREYSLIFAPNILNGSVSRFCRLLTSSHRLAYEWLTIGLLRNSKLSLYHIFFAFLCYTAPLSHPSNIFLNTPINVPFSRAAATLSLSPSCLLTCSAVLCVPSLILTSTLNLGGKACSRRTRTPRPMTVASEQ